MFSPPEGETTLAAAFAYTLRTVRAGRKFTQMELAERANLHLSAIQSLETGRRSPSLETLFRLARALGYTPFRFVQWVDDHNIRLDDEPVPFADPAPAKQKR